MVHTIMTEQIYRWRGLDPPSLEVLRLQQTAGGINAHSTLSVSVDPSYAVSYEWQLDENWCTAWLRIRLEGEEERGLLIERTGDSTWLVDGAERPDLDGCEEIDLSVTPFCNTLALKRLAGSGELTTLYVSFPDLKLQPSHQSYERLSTRTFVYTDLGAVEGFEARLEVDANGIVTHYEGLFEHLPEPL
jgi:hypothetical protein